MKIAIRSESNTRLDSMRSGHFGHAPFFTIVTYTDSMDIESVESVKNVDHDAVGCGGVIDFVSSLDVDGILAAGMGMPPFTRFINSGVQVYSDTTEPNVGKWRSCSPKARSHPWTQAQPAATNTIAPRKRAWKRDFQEGASRSSFLFCGPNFLATQVIYCIQIRVLRCQW